MAVMLELGLSVINSYRRLAYTPWHALAEFVDNSTQSYANNSEQLDIAFAREQDILTISIVYERETGVIRISDNSMGMSFDELQYLALPNRCATCEYWRPIPQFGMGMKTAACWFFR